MSKQGAEIVGNDQFWQFFCLPLCCLYALWPAGPGIVTDTHPTRNLHPTRVFASINNGCDAVTDNDAIQGDYQ